MMAMRKIIVMMRTVTDDAWRLAVMRMITEIMIMLYTEHAWRNSLQHRHVLYKPCQGQLFGVHIIENIFMIMTLISICFQTILHYNVNS